jgi:hypothetical protein
MDALKRSHAVPKREVMHCFGGRYRNHLRLKIVFLPCASTGAIMTRNSRLADAVIVIKVLAGIENRENKIVLILYDFLFFAGLVASCGCGGGQRRQEQEKEMWRFHF